MEALPPSTTLTQSMAGWKTRDQPTCWKSSDLEEGVQVRRIGTL